MKETSFKGKKRRKSKKMNWGLAILAVPGIIFLLAFNYVPLFGLVLPFKDLDYSKGIFGSDWVGFDNFKFFFQSQDAFRITRNTLVLNALFITINLVVAVVLALILFEMKKRNVKIYQTAIFVPYFISWIVASYILYALLNPVSGMIPKGIMSMGGTMLNVYVEPKYWPMILVLCSLWKSVGYNTLLYYTTLIGIDPTYYEAAVIDGATKFNRIRYISLPFLKPIVIMLTVLQIGKIFNSDFGMFYFLTRNSGLLYPVTDVIDTYVYRSLTVTGDVGMSAAVGLYQALVGFVLVMGSNLIVRKIDKDSAIF